MQVSEDRWAADPSGVTCTTRQERWLWRSDGDPGSVSTPAFWCLDRLAPLAVVVGTHLTLAQRGNRDNKLCPKELPRQRSRLDGVYVKVL